MTHQKKEEKRVHAIYIMRKHIGLLKACYSYRLFILDAHIFYSNIKRSSKLCLSAKKAKEKCNILLDDDDSTHQQSLSATLNILRDILEHMISIFVLIPNICPIALNGCQSESMFYIDQRNGIQIVLKNETNHRVKRTQNRTYENNKNEAQINMHIKNGPKRVPLFCFFIFASIKKPSNTFCQ